MRQALTHIVKEAVSYALSASLLALIAALASIG